MMNSLLLGLVRSSNDEFFVAGLGQSSNDEFFVAGLGQVQ